MKKVLFEFSLDIFFLAGKGWATIKLKHFNGDHLEKPEYKNFFIGTSVQCDATSKCDPFVRMFVDGENVLETVTKSGTEDFDIDETYFTPNAINKTAIIKIEVMDEDSEKRDDNPHKMLTTIGTVEEFMQKPVRCSDTVKFEGNVYYGNCIEVEIIWQDKRD